MAGKTAKTARKRAGGAAGGAKKQTQVASKSNDAVERKARRSGLRAEG
jgi:hypothetical protein